MCVRLSIAVAATGGRVTLSIGDQTAVSLANMNTLPAGGCGNVTVGMNLLTANHPGAEVYMDEVAVSASPLACG